MPALIFPCFALLPFSFRLFNRNFHALTVSDLTVIPPENKFIRLTVQVLAAYMVERTHYTTLEQAEKTFSGVHMGNRALFILPSVFVNGVIHNIVALELLLKADINGNLISLDYC